MHRRRLERCCVVRRIFIIFFIHIILKLTIKCFAYNYENNDHIWKWMIFAFSQVFGTSGMNFLWRQVYEEYHSDCVVPAVKQEPSITIFWKYVALSSVGEMVVCEVRRYSKKYINLLLTALMLPLMVNFSNTRWIWLNFNKTTPLFTNPQPQSIGSVTIILSWSTSRPVSKPGPYRTPRYCILPDHTSSSRGFSAIGLVLQVGSSERWVYNPLSAKKQSC